MKIRDRGGKCVPCRVDHEDDSQIADLFHKIDTEQNGRLDILVNKYVYLRYKTIILPLKLCQINYLSMLKKVPTKV